jgi:hypothetical protein
MGFTFLFTFLFTFPTFLFPLHRYSSFLHSSLCINIIHLCLLPYSLNFKSSSPLKALEEIMYKLMHDRIRFDGNYHAAGQDTDDNSMNVSLNSDPAPCRIDPLGPSCSELNLQVFVQSISVVADETAYQNPSSMVLAVPHSTLLAFGEHQVSSLIGFQQSEIPSRANGLGRSSASDPMLTHGGSHSLQQHQRLLAHFFTQAPLATAILSPKQTLDVVSPQNVWQQPLLSQQQSKVQPQLVQQMDVLRGAQPSFMQPRIEEVGCARHIKGLGMLVVHSF